MVQQLHITASMHGPKLDHLDSHTACISTEDAYAGINTLLLKQATAHVDAYIPGQANWQRVKIGHADG